MIHNIHHVYPGISKEGFQEIIEQVNPGGRDEIHFHRGAYKGNAIFIPHNLGLEITGEKMIFKDK